MGVALSEQIKFSEKLNLAAGYENIGNYLHALQIYTSLIESDETYIEPYLRLVLLYEKTGRIEEAEKVLGKLTELNSGSDYALIFASEFLIRFSKWEKALSIVKNIDESVYPIAYYWSGLCNYNMKNYKQARKSLEYLRKIDDKYEYWSHALFLLANIEFDTAKYNEALELAREVEFVHNDNWELYLLLAKIYDKLDMIVHAEEKILKALQFSKGNAAVYESAAKIFLKSGKLKKSEKYFNLLLESTDEISAEIYSSIASIAEANKEIEKARLYYELALSIDSGYRPAMNALSWLKTHKEF